MKPRIYWSPQAQAWRCHDGYFKAYGCTPIHAFNELAWARQHERLRWLPERMRANSFAAESTLLGRPHPKSPKADASYIWQVFGPLSEQYAEPHQARTDQRTRPHSKHYASSPWHPIVPPA